VNAPGGFICGDLPHLTSCVIPNRPRARDILSNWRDSARDLPPDSAELYYYTISPMFRGTKWARPTPSGTEYSEESAEMVEEVMREMYRWKPKARRWLILYWLHMPNNRELGKALGLSERWVRHKVALAHDVFADTWGAVFYDEQAHINTLKTQ